MRADRSGFTLIEVLVALVIGAVVLASARALIDGLADQATATSHAARVADRRANAELMAREVVGNLSLAPVTASSFSGTPREALFASWCPSARGDLERCDVRLFVRDRGAVQDVVLDLSFGRQITLLESASSVRLRYLSDASAGGVWQSLWSVGVNTPLAVGVLADGDTLLLRIGERR